MRERIVPNRDTGEGEVHKVHIYLEIDNWMLNMNKGSGHEYGQGVGESILLLLFLSRAQ